jgi:hypothetical protein
MGYPNSCPRRIWTRYGDHCGITTIDGPDWPSSLSTCTAPPHRATPLPVCLWNHVTPRAALCRALSCRTLPVSRPVLPHPAGVAPCPAAPCRCRAVPCSAAPLPALPRLRPRRQGVTLPAQSRRRGSTSLATSPPRRLPSPRLASPRLASPRLASPRLASAGAALRRLATPRLGWRCAASARNASCRLALCASTGVVPALVGEEGTWRCGLAGAHPTQHLDGWIGESLTLLQPWQRSSEKHVLVQHDPIELA